MFHHIVLMKFSPSVDAEFHARVEEYSEALRQDTPGLRHYVYTRNIASRNDGLEYVITSTFDSSADHDRYQVSPTHVAMKDYMMPMIERIVVCDIDEEEPK